MCVLHHSHFCIHACTYLVQKYYLALESLRHTSGLMDANEGLAATELVGVHPVQQLARVLPHVGLVQVGVVKLRGHVTPHLHFFSFLCSLSTHTLSLFSLSFVNTLLLFSVERDTPQCTAHARDARPSVGQPRSRGVICLSQTIYTWNHCVHTGVFVWEENETSKENKNNESIFSGSMCMHA